MKTLIRAAFVAAVLHQSAAAQQTVAGEWMLTAHEEFGPNIMRLSLTVAGDKLSGTAGGRPIEGTVRGSSIEFKMDRVIVKGSLEGADLKGEAVFPDRTVKWTAVRIPPRPASPRTHEFEPSAFQLYFSSKVKPVLHIQPGDTGTDLERGRWRGGQDGQSPLPGWESADGPVLCRRGRAERYAGRAPEQSAHESRLGKERHDDHAQRARAWSARGSEMG